MLGEAAADAGLTIIRGASAFSATRPVVAVLGNFDGVHLGHQALLAAARQAATKLGGIVVVYTFDPHPAQVLAPARAPVALGNIEQKTALLFRHGADALVIESFTPAFAAQPADAFFYEVLRARLGAAVIVVG